MAQPETWSISSPLETLAGITVASTNAEVADAYGADGVLREGDPGGFPPPVWNLDTPEGPLSAFADGNKDGDEVYFLADGDLQFCE